MRFAPESLACASPKRNRMLASSRDAGWSSLLLDHLHGTGGAEAYDKPVTPDFCLSIGVRGTVETSVLRNGRWRTAICQPGSVGLTRGGEGDRLRWTSRRPAQGFSLVSLYLPQAMIDEAVDQFRRIGQPDRLEPRSVLLLSDRLIAQTAVTLIRALQDGAPDLYAEAAGRWLAAHLVVAHAGRPGTADDASIVPDLRLARVIEYITANHHRALTIGDMAREAGISPFHFNRSFRRATGTTAHAFLTGHRMQAARRLLTTTDLQVGQVAVACGYSCATAFATAFARHTGCSPSVFRQDNR